MRNACRQDPVTPKRLYYTFEHIYLKIRTIDYKEDPKEESMIPTLPEGTADTIPRK